MDDSHYSRDDLIGKLYGVSSREDAHLARCEPCRRAWEELAATRRALIELEAGAEPGAARLARQREAVLRRIEKGRGLSWLPVPVLSAAAVLTLAIVLSPTAPLPSGGTTGLVVPDAQLFAEIYEVASSVEPPATASLRGLFEEQQP